MRNGGVHVLPVFQGHRNWIRVRYINPSNGRLDLLKTVRSEAPKNAPSCFANASGPIRRTLIISSLYHEQKMILLLD